MLCIVLLWVFACSLWEGCLFVCDAVAPDTLLGLKLQDNSACARLHSAVLLHYHMKFQVNQRVNLEASCCALFCYEYLRALYGRDAFCLWCFSSWHNAGPQAAGQLCFCTLTCRSVAFARVNLEVLCRIHIVTLLFYFVVLLLFFTNHIT